jgi:hypothetical protein
LVLYKRTFFGNPPVLKVFDLEFSDLDAITIEMICRRDLLLNAVASGDPAGLPRCEWFSRGCDYLQCCGYYESIPGEKFMVYDVWFKDLPVDPQTNSYQAEVC